MQPCYSPVRASREARAPIGTNAQMGKQEGTNWEMRATLPVLLCFCLCKEKEMFVRPISQNDLPLIAGGPDKPPTGGGSHWNLLPVHTECKGHLWHLD